MRMPVIDGTAHLISHYIVQNDRVAHESDVGRDGLDQVVVVKKAGDARPVCLAQHQRCL